LLKDFCMTRAYRARRITQPLPAVLRVRPTAVNASSFTCFRLVPAGDDYIALQLEYSSARMAVFATEGIALRDLCR
jgi:hypothetical protein